MFFEAILKARGQRLIQLSTASRAGRNMLDMSNLATISRLVGKIVEESRCVHYGSFLLNPEKSLLT